MKRGLELDRERLIAAGKIDGAGRDLFGKPGNYVRGVAAAQDQAAGFLPQRRLQRLQALRQPPAARTAMPPWPRTVIVKDEQRDDGRAGLGRRIERGVIRQPQIAAEPEDDWRLGHGKGSILKIEIFLERTAANSFRLSAAALINLD